MRRQKKVSLRSRLPYGNSMAVGLLLICLTGLVLSEERPDVNCLVVNLDYVHCVWHGPASPDVNYTFYSRFHKGFNECARYVLENNTIVGCDHPYKNLIADRCNLFTTKLVLVNRSFEQNHTLKKKVKLNPPISLTVKNGSDSNLWYYWNYSHNNGCIVSQVRHRIKGKEWKIVPLNISTRSYSINLPSSRYCYELQVRSTIDFYCGESYFWSDWSPPVFWGSMTNSTGPGRLSNPPSVWTPVLWALGSLVIVLLFAAIVVRHERIKVILVPILPDPGKNLTKILADGNVEDWLPISKSIKEGFKANYSERACSVREYSRISQSASESSAEQSCSDQSSGSCASSVTTDQTNCSVSPSVNEPAGPTSCACDASTATINGSSVETQGAG